MAKVFKFLYEQLREEVGRKTIQRVEIPLSIRQNLHPKMEMRPYQADAFRHFIAYMEEEHELRPSPAHVLFQMATGSGKTMMMAGLILYLYEKGYRNFLFFVNSTTIIDKTKDNFLNGASTKYLFAPQIKVGDRLVNIVHSENFQGDSGEDICMVFDTIQGLHSKLTTPRENAVTIEDFEDKKVVLIADEAHHLSAGTKQGKLFDAETDDIINWEDGVLKILNSNKSNLLLDFTATAELRNEYVASKYKDKLLFDYPLKAFRQDGYSKEVEIFRSDSELMERALQAVVLSHYRKKRFADMGHDIKPVILFKSKNIEPSKQFMADFIEKVESLKTSDLEHIKAMNKDGILKIAFTYFEEKRLESADLIEELKTDFSKERCVSANDDKEKGKLQIQLNTLESPENPIRAVFAVDKLNEGWDVLNLFDIVRLYETRVVDTKGKYGKATAAEAQLIGRGARYCPFIFGNNPKDKRKFDQDAENPYRICETMYYHSNNDSRYINEITQALVETGIVEEKTTQVRLGLKPSFEKSDIYQKGLIFLNEQEEVRPLELGLGAEIRKKIYPVDLLSGKTATAKVFKEDGDPIENANTSISKSVKVLKMRDLGIHVVRKALHQIKGFEFERLKDKFQQLEGLHEFIVSEDYLSNIEIHISGGKEQIESISQNDKLRIAKQVLRDLHIIENSEGKQYRGTKIFRALPLRSVIKEKVVNYAISSEEEGKGMNNPISRYHDAEIVRADWYAFTDCFGTSEEKALVKYMKAKYEEMKDSFDEFYLVRNERYFAIYEFEQGRRFEPDYVLFLKKRGEEAVRHYQIFIEPKGEYLMKEDVWKENFLVRINNEATVEKTALNGSKDVVNHIRAFWADDEFTVWGLPFFNEKDERKARFNEALMAVANK